jgi:DNA-binding transcriptional LysR family regulator
MDRIDEMAVFAEVAERESFSAAARRLNRSAAAVTRAVGALEARLGVRLLNRTTRAVSLTEAGQRFLDGARRVLADLGEIEQAAAGQGRAPRGELAITAPIVFGRLHVLPVVTAFLAKYPDVTARLVLLDRPVDLVEEGLDVAIRIGALADSSAVASRLGELHYLLVAAPAYLRKRGAPRRPEDLADHDVIAFTFTSAAHPHRWVLPGAGGDVTVRVAPRLTVTTAEAAIDAARAGLGIVRVLSYQAASALADKSLVLALDQPASPDLPVNIVYPGGRHPAPKLRAFVDFAAPRLRRQLDELSRALAG